MKKILILILLVIISCGKKEDQNVNKITFWHFWSEPNQKQVLDSIITEFTNQTGIEVETTELSWNDGKTKLFAAFNSGTGPDVLELGSDWVAQFSSQGVLAEQKNNLNKFLDWSKDPCFWDNKQYATPWIVDSRILFYNKKILGEYDFKPGHTYSEIYSQCLDISNQVDKEYYGFGLNGPDKNRLYKKALMFMWSAGGEVLKDGNSVINSEQNELALSSYNKFKEVGIIESQKNLDMLFLEGKLAYNMSGGWLITKIKNENPDLQFGIMNMPAYDSYGKGIAFAGGEYLSINNSSRKKANAQKFIDYLTTGKNSIEFCKKIVEAGFPADKDYYNNEFYKNDPLRSIIAQQLEMARMTPVHPKWLEIQDEVEAAFERVIYEYDDPKNSLIIANEKINKILKRD